MSNKSESYAAATRAQADQIVNQLKAANFSSNDISIHFPDGEESRSVPPQPLHGSSGVMVGAFIGGVIGIIVGWVAGADILRLPLSAAGSLAAGLSGAAGGAVAGGLVGWLVVFLISKKAPPPAPPKVVSANIVVSVNTPDTERFVRARHVFGKPIAPETPSEPKP